MDWDDLRFFQALLRHKTLSATAQHLRVTQSTVGRRLASLEASLGVRLVHRTREGYVPTAAGEAIREHIDRVEAETQAVRRVVGGLDRRLEGVVRVTSPTLLASHLLAPCTAALHAEHPEIMVELLCYVPSPNLAARDADVAVQLGRFEQADLVVRRIGTLAFGLYASVAYLSQRGEPDAGDGCPGHHLVTLVEDTRIPAQADWLAAAAGRARVMLRTDSRETQVWATLQGGGLALLPCFRADREPALRRLDTPAPAPGAEIWMAVHQDHRQVPRVRAVLDCIAEAARRGAGALYPECPKQRSAPGPGTAEAHSGAGARRADTGAQ
jgi:DNA-binding transcriptional LysR family regulator